MKAHALTFLADLEGSHVCLTVTTLLNQRINDRAVVDMPQQLALQQDIRDVITLVESNAPYAEVNTLIRSIATWVNTCC